MYESLVMVDPDVDISVDAVAAELRRFYTKVPDAPLIETKGSEILLRWPGYTFAIHREAMPHVLEESVEIAEQFGARLPHRDRVARCRVRFSTQGDEDPSMNRFNDY
ncbi:MAG: hypothetical protein ACXWN1_31940, partial [Thermoanaerobaculia bacterium]